MVDQGRAILVNQWLTDVELEGVRGEVERENTDVIMDSNNHQERTQFEGYQNERGADEQETQGEVRNDRDDRIGNTDDSIGGLDLKEDIVYSEEETEQLNTICTFYRNKKQPPKVTFKKVNKKKI